MHPLDQADAPESVLSVGGTPGGVGTRHSPWAGVCALASAARAVSAARSGPPSPPSTIADAALFAHSVRQLATDAGARVAVAARPGVPRGRAATLLRHSLVARLFWDGALGGAVEGRRGPVAVFVGTLVGAVAGQAAAGGGGGGVPSTRPPRLHPPPPPFSTPPPPPPPPPTRCAPCPTLPPPPKRRARSTRRAPPRARARAAAPRAQRWTLPSPPPSSPPPPPCAAQPPSRPSWPHSTLATRAAW